MNICAHPFICPYRLLIQFLVFRYRDVSTRKCAFYAVNQQGNGDMRKDETNV